jgi:hypothetical protein
MRNSKYDLIDPHRFSTLFSEHLNKTVKKRLVLQQDNSEQGHVDCQ